MSKHEIYPPLSPMWTPSPVELSTWVKTAYIWKIKQLKENVQSFSYILTVSTII